MCWCWPSTASRPPGHLPGTQPPSDQPPHSAVRCCSRPGTSRSSGSQPNNPTPVRMVTLAAHRDRPSEAALRRRVSPGTSARIRHSCSHSWPRPVLPGSLSSRRFGAALPRRSPLRVGQRVSKRPCEAASVTSSLPSSPTSLSSPSSTGADLTTQARAESLRSHRRSRRATPRRTSPLPSAWLRSCLCWRFHSQAPRPQPAGP